MAPSSSTKAAAPASSSFHPPQNPPKARAVSIASVSSASSNAPTAKKALQAQAAAAGVTQNSPVALKPSTRNSAPQNILSPAVTPTSATSTSGRPTASTPRTQPRQQQQQQQAADVMTMSAVISPAPMADAPVMSMTTKEWVIPPRPKPGRKPATDTPPTKRKAQNRAAQRAFRERRAARVGELEEQLDQQKAEHDQRDASHRDTIRDLELEVQSFRSRCLLLENMLERERKERLQAETMLETMRRQAEERPVLRTNSLPEPALQNVHSSVPKSSMQHRHSNHGTPAISSPGSNTLAPITNISGAGPQGYFDTNTDAPMTCGNCEPNGRCACVEEVLNASCGKCGSGNSCQCVEDANAMLGQGPELKRSASPSGVPPQKRSRSSHDAHSATEADFTNMFQRRPTVETSRPSAFEGSGAMSGPPSLNDTFLKDDCGFCKDGTYCVCADTAMATPALTPVDTLPPISSQTRTPPPSESDVVSQPLIMEMTADGAVKLPKRHASKKVAPQPMPRGCATTGPGTCDQCRADPKSGLFCRLMAANFKKGEGGGCGGGKGADGGCCKTKNASSASTPASAPAKEKITLPSLPSLGLSCAEAYQTLASHRNFDRAADDISSWLPMLKATTPARDGPASTSRPAKGGKMGPIEVEAASIMSVLKDFDVRFGREA